MLARHAGGAVEKGSPFEGRGCKHLSSVSPSELEYVFLARSLFDFDLNDYSNFQNFKPSKVQGSAILWGASQYFTKK